MQPPPLPASAPARVPGRVAVFVSAFVYPGAGQFIQRRWLAGVFWAATFTVGLVYFTLTAMRILMAYYGLAADFNADPEMETGLVRRMLLGLGVSLLFYFGNLVDVVVAGRRARAARS